jgi:hypothetical protein
MRSLAILAALCSPVAADVFVNSDLVHAVELPNIRDASVHACTLAYRGTYDGLPTRATIPIRDVVWSVHPAPLGGHRVIATCKRNTSCIRGRQKPVYWQAASWPVFRFLVGGPKPDLAVFRGLTRFCGR